MWYVKVFLVFVVVILVLLFALANRGQEVVIRGLDRNGGGYALDFVLALFLAFAVGVLTFFLISLFREVRLRRRCAKLERDVHRLRMELDALRTAPLEGPLEAVDAAPQE